MIPLIDGRSGAFILRGASAHESKDASCGDEQNPNHPRIHAEEAAAQALCFQSDHARPKGNICLCTFTAPRSGRPENDALGTHRPFAASTSEDGLDFRVPVAEHFLCGCRLLSQLSCEVEAALAAKKSVLGVFLAATATVHEFDYEEV